LTFSPCTRNREAIVVGTMGVVMPLLGGRKEDGSLVKDYIRLRIREALVARQARKEQRLAEQSTRMASGWQQDLRAGRRDW